VFKGSERILGGRWPRKVRRENTLCGVICSVEISDNVMINCSYDL
jgi:hypothetical protein